MVLTCRVCNSVDQQVSNEQLAFVSCAAVSAGKRVFFRSEDNVLGVNDSAKRGTPHWKLEQRKHLFVIGEALTMCSK